MQPTVRTLFVYPQKKAPPLALTEVRAAESGLEGDWHAKSNGNRRQILVLSGDVLREFELAPGSLFENMTIDGIDVMQLKPGQQLHIGDVVLEVTLPCEPCIQMERIRQGLQRALNGKRGMFVRVIKPGTLRVDDAVRQL